MGARCSCACCPCEDKDIRDKDRKTQEGQEKGIYSYLLTVARVQLPINSDDAVKVAKEFLETPEIKDKYSLDDEGKPSNIGEVMHDKS